MGKLPSDDEIEHSKIELTRYLNKVATGEISIASDKETLTSKLMLIKDIIEPLKSHIINKKITYVGLSKILEQQIKLTVSAQTLRHFCQNNLGFPKKVKQNNIELKQDNTAIQTAKVINKVDDLAQENMDFK